MLVFDTGVVVGIAAAVGVCAGVGTGVGAGGDPGVGAGSPARCSCARQVNMCGGSGGRRIVVWPIRRTPDRDFGAWVPVLGYV